MPLNKEQMREYQRKRRAGRKSVNLDCKPQDVNLDCKPARFKVTEGFLDAYRRLTPNQCVSWLKSHDYDFNTLKPGESGYVKDFEISPDGYTEQELLAEVVHNAN